MIFAKALVKSATIGGLALGLMALGAPQAEAHGWGRYFDRGLSQKARWELKRSGLTKYLGKFKPISSEPFQQDWTRHDFDSDGGHGPVCIDGSDFSVFTKKGDPKKLIIFLQGGGACWQGLFSCNIKAANQFPGPEAFLPGVFSQANPVTGEKNPLGDWSVAYMPYCDGSVWAGDNEVEDPFFTSAITGQDLTEEGKRRHRGLRNLSAGMDVAKRAFPKAKKILVTGSSAGGVGAAAWAPFLTRFKYGDRSKLYVFNDAGPIVGAPPERAPISYAARDNDWNIKQFYPKSCVKQGLCDPFDQATGLVRWRLQNDRDVLEAFYSTDADQTNLGFVNVNGPAGAPNFLVNPPIIQPEYRSLLDEEHGALNAAFPRRYKRFIVSGANPVCDAGGAVGLAAFTHTVLQSQSPGSCPSGQDYFYNLVSQKTGVSLVDYVNDFVRARGRPFLDRYRAPAWVDSAEDCVTSELSIDGVEVLPGGVPCAALP